MRSTTRVAKDRSAKPQLSAQDLKKTLGNSIAYHALLVPLCGSINAALFLSQAIRWQSKEGSDDGWFYKTRDEWKSEIGLSHFQQQSARKLLKERGFIHEKRKGQTGNVWFFVDLEAIAKAVELRSETAHMADHVRRD